MTGWINKVVGYTLPDGLADRDPCRVVGPVPDRQTLVEVETNDAKRWVLDWWMVDCGYEIKNTSGRYCHESDPEILAELERSVVRLRAQIDKGRPFRDSAESLERILRRNGRQV